jgi:hypothetical protein
MSDSDLGAAVPGESLPRRNSPQAPWIEHRYAGALVGAIGCGVSVFAFLFLPYVTLSMVSLTAPQNIAYLAEFGQPGWQLVWLVPGVTMITGIVSLTQYARVRYHPSVRLAGLRLVQFLCVILVASYVLNVIVLAIDNNAGLFDTSPINYLGAGFWLGLLGVCAAWVGSTMELRTLNQWKRDAQRWHGWR